MIRILKWSLAVIFLAAMILIAVQFVLVNTEPQLQPQFVLVWGSKYAWHLTEPWPAGLLLLCTFLGGTVAGLIVAVFAGAGMEMRILRYRKEIKNLRREVESLRVSDLDEDVERELAGLGEDEQDELLDSRTRLSPPVSSGAASSLRDDADTNVDYDGLLGSRGDLDEDEALATRNAADADT